MSVFLPRWVLISWQGMQVAFALDTTTWPKGHPDCFADRTISVVYPGCAVPVAWTVLATSPRGLFRCIVPRSGTSR